MSMFCKLRTWPLGEIRSDTETPPVAKFWSQVESVNCRKPTYAPSTDLQWKQLADGWHAPKGRARLASIALSSSPDGESNRSSGKAKTDKSFIWLI